MSRSQNDVSFPRIFGKWPLGVLVAACAACLLSCRATPSADPPEPLAQHLILLTVDTWRGDHFLTERGEVDLTPWLSRFAQGATTFAQASSVAAETSPGTAGILTGLLPRRSGVVANVHVLSETLPTLATVLAAQGFATAAFVANPVLAPGFGFENGFEVYELVPRAAGLRKARADRLSQRALEWLSERSPDERFFLWLHFMDPHGPYQPPEEYASLFPVAAFEAERDIPLLGPGDQSGKGGIPFYQQAPGGESSRDGRDYLARYAAEVRFMDHEVGRVLERLERERILDETVVVLTSDHGEALVDDHGYYFSHGNGMTQDQLHVPLLLHYPGGAAGAVVEDPVSTLGILPTVSSLLGVTPPSDLDGVSLLGSDLGEAISQGHREQAIRQGPWKLRIRGRRSELYHLDGDSGETRDLGSQHSDEAERLRRRLLEVRKRPKLAEPVKRANPSQEEREALKTLGYL